MKNKKRNKVITILNLILSIFTPIFVVVVTASLLYAWYTNTIQTGSLDASTQNVSIEYKINNSEDTNVLTYNISNLAFFDSTATQETKYLNTMAFRIDLNIKNKSKTAVGYRVLFESTKTVVQNSNNETISRAYPACIYDNVTPTSSLTTVTSFLSRDNATNNDTVFNSSKSGSSDLDVDASTTITLYVFGIQDIAQASSDDFLYTANRADTRTYSFKLSIIAEPKGEATVAENSGE